MNKFNNHYFDNIDTSDKAYWIGFIWCDGSLVHRIRENNRDEYNLKISLMESDYKHLEKFNKCLDGNYKIHFYDSNSSFAKTKECRIFITNKYMGRLLETKYGIISYRTDISKLLNYIPQEFERDFIRGVLDADGSFSKYTIHNNIDKHIVRFGGNKMLLNYINDIFIKNNLVPNFNRKHSKRHPNRDGDYYCLTFSGINCCKNILSWLYENADIYLDRKYKKYKDIFNNEC